MARLSDSDRVAFLANHPDWALEEEAISREFLFRDFNEAMGFVTRVALAAEVADHHPHIDVRWNRVTLVLTTHSEGALTVKDTDLAAAADGFVSDGN